MVSALLAAAALPAQVSGQTPTSPFGEWRRVGNTVLALGLASPAGGPVDRVWFSRDGLTLFAHSPSGRVWQTADLDHWSVAERIDVPPPEAAASISIPESGVRTVAPQLRRTRLYAAGRNVWRSEDGGTSWTNVTAFDGNSILGGRLSDVAVSPANPDEIVVAGEYGIWRSLDGGSSWVGLNDGLPNLPGSRLLALPDEDASVRIATPAGREFLWRAGERTGWRPAADSLLARDAAVRSSTAAALGLEVTAAARSADQVYAGAADGRLFTSPDRGQSWRPHSALPGSGAVTRIIADTRDPLFAIAITNSRQRARVLRTLNGGVLWDDITSNVPPGAVQGITSDRLTGAVYIATAAGVFMTYTDTVAASPATPWTELRKGAAADVMLDAAGNQLYVLMEGAGVLAALAPHRTRDPRVVSAGDRILRAAAPGSLLSIIGAHIDSAQAGDRPAPVLAAGDTESQVQLPFELNGTGVLVSMSSAAGRLQLGLPLAPTSPSIFVDRDGNPLIMNADSGLMLDAATPARSGARIQILATGLGRVTPVWPAGLAAPLQDPPRVVAPVRAYVEREALEVTRATLAPGYVGMYLIEVQMPAIVNRGTAEFYIQAGDEISNKVRIYLEP